MIKEENENDSQHLQRSNSYKHIKDNLSKKYAESIEEAIGYESESEDHALKDKIAPNNK